MSEWRPIETAPRDGTEILAYRRDCGILLVRWIAPIVFMTEHEMRGLSTDEVEGFDWFAADFVSGCRLEGDETPTHWMPLPAPPQDEGERK